MTLGKFMFIKVIYMVGLLIILFMFTVALFPACQNNGAVNKIDEKEEEIEPTDKEKAEKAAMDDNNVSEILSTDKLKEVEEKVVLESMEPVRLIIPVIDLDLLVLSDEETYDPEKVGNEPWKFSSEEYSNWINELMPLLNKGPVHYQFSALPGKENGNVVIAGHSPGPWYHFYDLALLEEGDQIYLETAGYRFVYKVKWDRVVDKYDWSPLFDTDYPALTFQTCYPKDYEEYDPPERLMVRAELDQVFKLPE